MRGSQRRERSAVEGMVVIQGGGVGVIAIAEGDVIRCLAEGLGHSPKVKV